MARIYYLWLSCLCVSIISVHSAIKSESGQLDLDINNDNQPELIFNGNGMGLNGQSPSQALEVTGNALIESGSLTIGTTPGNSTLEIHGSLALSSLIYSANAEIATTSSLILGQTQSDNITLYLPNPSSMSGRIVHVKNLDDNTLTVSGNGTLIDQKSVVTLSGGGNNRASAKFLSNGSQWYLLSLSGNTLALGSTWTNTGGDNLASNANNWSDGQVPTNGTHIILSNNNVANLTWDLDVQLASWHQTSGYTGTVTINTVYPGQGSFTQLNISEWLIVNGGTWTHQDNSNDEVNRLSLSVGSHFTLGASASFNVNDLGFDTYQGPGAPSATLLDGASYGGMGGDDSPNSTTNATYGSITAAGNLGSGGSQGLGGGAIVMTVTGASTINGSMTAGSTSVFNSGGAGGTVNLTSSSISGTGSLTANGGGSSGRGAGGGGRIVVKLTGTGQDHDTFTGTLSAFGANSSNGRDEDGAAGTVYLETQAQSSGSGNLIIDNNDLGDEVYGSSTTLMPTSVDLGEFNSIVIRNKGNLGIDSDDTLAFSSANISGEGAGEAFITLTDVTGVSFPENFSISSYTLNADALSTFNGNLTIAATGALGHSNNYSSNVFALNLTINGNLTIDANGAIDSTGMGYNAGLGPGASNGTYDGGSHGGMGGDDAPNDTVEAVYGSITAAGNLGSGGGSLGGGFGGGAVILTVTGDTLVNGDIASDGNLPTGNGAGGSGGTVNLTTATLSGTGNIGANGSDSNNYGAGGGGRVVVVLTGAGADFESFSGSTRAYGGNSSNGRDEDGSAGTVYLETQAQASGSGNLIIDNNDISEVYGRGNTTMPANTDMGVFTEIIIRNNGNLGIGADDTIAFASDNIIGEGANDAFITIVDPTGVSFPDSFTLTQYTLNVDALTTFNGDFIISTNGVLSHSNNYDDENYKISLTINGNLIIDEQGEIHTLNMGYDADKGPGAPTNGSLDGGGYGGIGGDNGLNGTTSQTYGSFTAPGNIGSGSDASKGAGAIILTVTGNTIVNGTINGNADFGVNNNSSGAGGSVYLTTGTLSGNGNISANGQGTNGQGSGSGGRISVILTATGADFENYNGQFTAYGGDTYNTSAAEDGSAGTIYTQTQAQSAGSGNLLIDNNNLVTTSSVTTALNSSGNRTISAGNVSIVNGGKFSIDNDDFFTVTGNLHVSSIFYQSGGNVTANILHLDSPALFENTTAGNILIGSGGVSNSGNITLNGAGTSCGDSEDILIRSDSDGNQRNWVGSGNFTMIDLDIKDQGGTASITAYHSTNTANNDSNWVFNAACP